MKIEGCAKCQYEETCGYSPLAMTKSRGDYSFSTCVLGEKENGEPFFRLRQTPNNGLQLTGKGAEQNCAKC